MKTLVVKHKTYGRIRVNSFYLKYLDVSKETIEEFIKSQDGIIDAKLNKTTGSLSISYDPNKIYIEEFLELINNTPIDVILGILKSYKTKPKPKEENPSKLRMLLGVVGGLLSLTPIFPNPFVKAITIFGSIPSFKSAITNLLQGRLSYQLLDSLALGITIQRNMLLSSNIMNLFIGLGDYLEDKLNQKARASIEDLLNVDGETAYIEKDGTKIEVPIEEISIGDIVVVYAGGRIPVDGIVNEGKAVVNESVLTGEDKPVLKEVGAKVYAGTNVVDGKIYIRVEQKGTDTIISKIAHMVESYMDQKPAIYDRFNKLADATVLPILSIGLANQLITRNLAKTSSILTIDYNTNLRVSIPIAVASSISKASTHGILIKGGRSLEAMSKIQYIVMDKTGTITKGEPVITDLIPLEDSLNQEELLRIAASLEQRLKHPIAEAIVNLAKEKSLELYEREDSDYDIGLGISAKLLQGQDTLHEYKFGSSRYMANHKISITKHIKDIARQKHDEGKTVLYLAKDKKIIGLIAFKDMIREEAKDVIRKLKDIGIKLMMLTGDNEEVAQAIAKEVGIEEFRARVSPEEKAKYVEKLKKEGYKVAMVGDGVNDSVALSAADLGIAMGDGSQVAIDVADVVLVKEDLNLIYKAIKLSKDTMRVVDNNIKFNFTINTLGIAMAILGSGNPAFSVMINNGSTILSALYSTTPEIENG
jgi:Cu2+-exporting ATPase